MKTIDVKDLKGNFFEMISKEWMLVTAGNADKYNTMTASWGCVGWLWNKPVAVIFIRPERYTHDFIEQDGVVTLAFLGDSPGNTQGLQLLRIEVGTRLRQGQGDGTQARGHP